MREIATAVRTTGSIQRRDRTEPPARASGSTASRRSRTAAVPRSTAASAAAAAQPIPGISAASSVHA